MALFKLPRLKANLAIVNKVGQPLNYFLLFWNTEVAPAIETTVKDIQEAQAQLAAQQAEIIATQEKILRILAGEENFTGLLVNEQNVRPFLDNTDGTKIVTPDGLGTAVVDTDKVVLQAITTLASANTISAIPLAGTADTIVQTLSYTTTGERLLVQANFFLTVYHPTAGGISTRIRIERVGLGAPLFDATFEAIGGDFFLGWQTPSVEDQPDPGTYTYNVIVNLDNNDADMPTAQARALTITEFKR